MNDVITLLIAVCGSGGLLTVLIQTFKSNKKLDENKKVAEEQIAATEKQTLQNTMIGRLRRCQEVLESRHQKKYNDFTEYLGGAYCRGNDKDTVKVYHESLKKNADYLDDVIDEITKAISDVYAGKLTEADVNRIIENAERKR